jgi:hypothetical protein
MLIWSIWALFLIGLRVESGTEFDYRPLLSFYLCVLVSGAAMIGMGLFFSSLSRNQIIAAVLTFIGMLLLLMMSSLEADDTIRPLWRAVFRQISYGGLWRSSLNGRLPVRDLVTQGSLAVFWLFLTVKVLEARRWS